WRNEAQYCSISARPRRNSARVSGGSSSCEACATPASPSCISRASSYKMSLRIWFFTKHHFPIVPVAGQHASRPDCALAERIAFVRAAIGDREQAALPGNNEHLLALVPHQPVAIGADLAAFQPNGGKHLVFPADCVTASEAKQSRACATAPRLLRRFAPRSDLTKS